MPFGSALFAGRWEQARFPEWDREFVNRILIDSPWAHLWKGTTVQPLSSQRVISNWSQLGVDLPSPIPGIGWPRSPRPGGIPRTSDPGGGVLRMGVELIIRWAGALPVRRAMALHEFGRDRLDDPQAVELLSVQPKDFVIEIAGFPHVLANAELARNLRETKLLVPNKRPLSPLSVEVPEAGTFVTATLRFARVEGLAPDDGKVELVAQAAGMRIEESFKLRPMVYEGRLEL